MKSPLRMRGYGRRRRGRGIFSNLARAAKTGYKAGKKLHTNYEKGKKLYAKGKDLYNTGRAGYDAYKKGDYNAVVKAGVSGVNSVRKYGGSGKRRRSTGTSFHRRRMVG